MLRQLSKLDRNLNLKQTYPSGRVVRNTYDAAHGSLSQVQSKRSSETYRNFANGFVYNAAGAVTAMRLGNGRWENTVFNSRLQPTQIGLGNGVNSQNLLKLDYEYGATASANNGNVTKQTITVPGVTHPFVQSYTYDELNRLKSATETQNTTTQTWKQTFRYDRYGNRNFDTTNNNTTTLPQNFDPDVHNPTVDTADNRFAGGQGYSYDAGGNTTADSDGTRSFVYDAENKQVTVAEGSTVVGQYNYDGDGRRVKKIGLDPAGQPEQTIFVYDAGGKLIGEYSTALQTGTSAKTVYTTNDHLGSPRINTDAIGQVASRHDYHPFGEEIARAGYGSDTVRKQFTGYERDNESGLDFAQARYYNLTHGRFTTVDPLAASALPSDPQTFNRYIYVRNSPLVMTDPTGMMGDYFDSQGRRLGGDGKDDGKIYFAEFVEDNGDGTFVLTNRRKTSLGEVLKAQDRAVAITPGMDDPIQELVQSTGGNLNDAITGIEIGAQNTVIGAANALTQPLGPGGSALGIPNPLEITPLQSSNAKQAAYAFIAETGITAMAGAAVGPASTGSSLSIASEVESTAIKTTGLQRQLQLHQEKLTDYAKNPYAHVNKGLLANAPESRHAQIIAGRVRNLVKQIRNFEKQIGN